MAQTTNQQIENAAELARFPDNTLVNVSSASRYLDVSTQTARRFIASGKLPKVVIGGSIRIPVSAIRQMLCC